MSSDKSLYILLSFVNQKTTATDAGVEEVALGRKWEGGSRKAGF